MLGAGGEKLIGRVVCGSASLGGGHVRAEGTLPFNEAAAPTPRKTGPSIRNGLPQITSFNEAAASTPRKTQ
jgi:hypothetical protein